MATGRNNGRPRKPKGKEAFIPTSITEEVLETIPTPPDDLTDDGLTLWYRIWSGGSAWLAEADYIVIHDLCQIYQEKELYRRAIDMGSVPRVYRMTNGSMAPHPYVNLLKSSRADLTTRLSSIGFTPTDRARLDAMESLVDDPIVDMVRRKQEREIARREMMDNVGEV